MRGASCGVVNMFSSDSASAHCLKFDESLTYQSYTIEEPRISFDINVQVGIPFTDDETGSVSFSY